jgi:antitoxin component YwqK of YwqJK toxin-antitoxin module
MFRIFVFTLLTFFSYSLTAQDTVNVSDKAGRKQGFWRKTDTSGRVVYEGRFRDGYPAGEFRYFYPDGKLKTTSMVSRQGKRAVTTSYFPNGKKMAAGIFINEKKDSTWQFFSESLGTLVSEETYKNGKVDGYSKVFFPEGGLSEVRFYMNGVRNGMWEEYYMDGAIKLRGAYRDGEKQGPFKMYYPNGQVMVSGQYREGHMNGTWTQYNDKGVVVQTDIYKNGVLATPKEPRK